MHILKTIDSRVFQISFKMNQFGHLYNVRLQGQSMKVNGLALCLPLPLSLVNEIICIIPPYQYMPCNTLMTILELALPFLRRVEKPLLSARGT